MFSWSYIVIIYHLGKRRLNIEDGFLKKNNFLSGGLLESIGEGGSMEQVFSYVLLVPLPNKRLSFKKIVRLFITPNNFWAALVSSFFPLRKEIISSQNSCVTFPGSIVLAWPAGKAYAIASQRLSYQATELSCKMHRQCSNTSLSSSPCSCCSANIKACIQYKIFTANCALGSQLL